MRINAHNVIARLIVSAAVVLFAGPATAQESAADCAEIEDDRERLACFDRVFSGSADAAGPAGESRAAGDAEAPRGAGQSSRERDAGRATRAGSAESTRTSAERNRRTARNTARERGADGGRESTEDRFGLENEVLDLGGQQRRSKAIGQFGFWERGQRIELENGQFWQVVDDDELYFKATNPALTIEKGLLGSYYLHLDGLSKSIKVKRIR